MTLAIANNMADYMSDAAHTDGIMFLHLTPEDGAALEALCLKYGKEVKRYREKEDLTMYSDPSILGDEPDEKPKKVLKEEKVARKVAREKKKAAAAPVVEEPVAKKTRAKSIWIHKRKQEKRVPETELSQYTSDGWKIGKANK